MVSDTLGRLEMKFHTICPYNSVGFMAEGFLSCLLLLVFMVRQVLLFCFAGLCSFPFNIKQQNNYNINILSKDWDSLCVVAFGWKHSAGSLSQSYLVSSRGDGWS